jgi:CrcB protein
VTPSPPSRVSALTAVALGGAVGALLRALVLSLAPSQTWAVLAVNVSGCFALALLPAVDAVRRRPLLPLLLGPGVLGGYTTLSTFAEVSRSLAASGDPRAAAGFVVASVAGGVLAVRVASRWVDPPWAQGFEDRGGDL